MIRNTPLPAARAPARLAALGLAAGLCACATTAPLIDASQALAGKDFDTATALYGHYQDRARIAGKDYYLWRRAVQVGDQSMVCELRVELAYRNMIRSSIVEGYPLACQQFSVRFTAAQQAPREPQAREPEAAKPYKACRKVATRDPLP